MNLWRDAAMATHNAMQYQTTYIAKRICSSCNLIANSGENERGRYEELCSSTVELCDYSRHIPSVTLVEPSRTQRPTYHSNSPQMYE